MLEALALPVHFEYVDVVGEAVQQCAVQEHRSEDLGPLVEGQVGREQDVASLIALGEYLGEALRLVLSKLGQLLKGAPVLSAGT